MSARASNSFYWPGLHHDIKNARNQCRDCNNIAPSNSDEPLIITQPQYPFEKVVADYFVLKGFNYLLYADRYSAWISIIKICATDGDSRFLKAFLSNLFAIFGVPEELATDGGSPFKSHDYKQFLQNWGVRPRLSAAHYPQSNGRAELAVGVAKRILTGNCDANGDIDNDRVARALLQYRNTPLQGIGLSPSQILYGRHLRDCMPSLKETMAIRPEWRIAADEREKALRKRHIKCTEAYNEHTKVLPELNVQDYVAVQNQNGNHPKLWDRTGMVVEKLPFRQYRVKMDGSNRVTLRNRKFLRKIEPVCAQPTIRHTPQIFREESSTSPAPPIVSSPSASISNTPPIVEAPTAEPIVSISNAPPIVEAPVSEPIVEAPVAQQTISRTSGRNRVPRTLFEASLRGKSHGSKSVSFDLNR